VGRVEQPKRAIGAAFARIAKHEPDGTAQHLGRFIAVDSPRAFVPRHNHSVAVSRHDRKFTGGIKNEVEQGDALLGVHRQRGRCVQVVGAVHQKPLTKVDAQIRAKKASSNEHASDAP
jgi:hypothetical protein